MKTKTIIAAAVAAGALTAPLFAAAAEGDIQVGQLTCRQTDNTNLVLFSNATFDCTFDPTKGPNQRFEGKVSKIGVDLSNAVETMVWFVFAPSNPEAEGALAGNYYGVSADASIGAGIGAKVLVGGFENSFTLQPAAISGQEGIGVAAGIEAFELKYLGN